MKINRSLLCLLSLPLLIIAAFWTPVLAQEEEEEDNGRFGATFAEVELWVAQASGLDYFPAIKMDPSGLIGAEPLSPNYSTESRLRYSGGYKLHKNRGALVITYYSHEEKTNIVETSPGDFIYGELLPVSTFAGFGNDGLADGFNANTRTLLRDLRIDFYRTAFDTPRARGKWFVGLRRVNHGRELGANYHALVPDLPALIPPLYEPPIDIIGLEPQSDEAYISSYFDGRGLGAGIEVEMPLWKNRILLEGGLNIAILRGKTDAVYESTTWYYLLQQIGNDIILEPPYNEFEQVIEEVPQIDLIVQLPSTDAMHVESLSSTAHVLEAELGFRWKAYKGLEWFGGFRSTRYTDVGLDLRSKAVPTYGGSMMGISEIDRSATYEGFYTGLAYSY
jgi:hypothetical protein